MNVTYQKEFFLSFLYFFGGWVVVEKQFVAEIAT